MEKNVYRQKLATKFKRKAVDDINSRGPRKIIIGDIELKRL